MRKAKTTKKNMLPWMQNEEEDMPIRGKGKKIGMKRRMMKKGGKC